MPPHISLSQSISGNISRKRRPFKTSNNLPSDGDLRQRKTLSGNVLCPRSSKGSIRVLPRAGQNLFIVARD